MKRDFVSVLDLGSSKAACLVAEPDGAGGLKILGASSADCRGVRRGVVTDLDEAARAVDGACRHAQQEAGRDVDNVVVAFGGGGVESVDAKGYVPIYPRTRAITRDDVLQVVNHSRQISLPPDREQILALPREFRIDGQSGISRPVGMVGGRLEVSTFLATGESAQIQNLERALSMTGRKAESVVPMALASGLGVLAPSEIELGSAVVDIGAGGTQVAVFAGGCIAFSAYIPIGSGHVTSDISKLLKTSPEEAERLKVSQSVCGAGVPSGETVEVTQIGQMHARALDRRVLCEIVESRMREIATMARQQIEKSGHFATLPAGIVLTGGGSQLPGADKLFDSVFGTKVRLAIPYLNSAASKTSAVHRQSSIGPGLSAAIGLARFALDTDEDELATASANGKWTEKVRTLWSMLSGKA